MRVNVNRSKDAYTVCVYKGEGVDFWWGNRMNGLDGRALKNVF